MIEKYNIFWTAQKIFETRSKYFTWYFESPALLVTPPKVVETFLMAYYDPPWKNAALDGFGFNVSFSKVNVKKKWPFFGIILILINFTHLQSFFFFLIAKWFIWG